MRLLFALVLTIFHLPSFCQQDSMKIALDRAVELHDKGQYDKALTIYDSLIAKDDQYYFAYFEKTYTLFVTQKYQDCIDLCEVILKKFPENELNGNIYSNYGSSLDAIGKARDAIKIFSAGIKKHPKSYLLYLNRGITEYSQQKNESAAEDMKKAIALNPLHSSSHHYLAYATHKKNKIASIMSMSVSILLQPRSRWSEQDLKFLLTAMGANVEKKDDKNVTVTLSSAMLNPKQHGDDDFHFQQMMISMESALDTDEKYKNLDAAQNLKRKLAVLADIENRNHGFFSQTYIPFFAALKADSLLETASYVIYSPANDSANTKWLADNESKVRALQDWIAHYVWKKDL